MKFNVQAITLILLLLVITSIALAQQNVSPSATKTTQPFRLAVMIEVGEKRMGGFNVTTTQSPLLMRTENNSAPTIYLRQPEFWLSPDVFPQTSDGQQVSAVRFRAWRDGEVIRVAVYALAQNQGSGKNAGAEISYAEKVIDLFDCRPGETREVSVMKEIGAKPVRISVVKSEALFKGQR